MQIRTLKLLANVNTVNESDNNNNKVIVSNNVLTTRDNNSWMFDNNTSTSTNSQARICTFNYSSSSSSSSSSTSTSYAPTYDQRTATGRSNWSFRSCIGIVVNHKLHQSPTLSLHRQQLTTMHQHTMVQTSHQSSSDAWTLSQLVRTSLWLLPNMYQRRWS